MKFYRFTVFFVSWPCSLKSPVQLSLWLITLDENRMGLCPVSVASKLHQDSNLQEVDHLKVWPAFFVFFKHIETSSFMRGTTGGAPLSKWTLAHLTASGCLPHAQRNKFYTTIHFLSLPLRMNSFSDMNP